MSETEQEQEQEQIQDTAESNENVVVIEKNIGALGDTRYHKYGEILEKAKEALKRYEEGGAGQQMLLVAERITSKFPDLCMKSQLSGKVTAPLLNSVTMKRKRSLFAAADKSIQRRRVVLERLKRNYKKRCEDEKKVSSTGLDVALDNLKKRKMAEIDGDFAPPPAPVSGYNIWQGQLKFKLMNERDTLANPNRPEEYDDINASDLINNIENKASAADMGKIWRIEVSEIDKRYYSVMAQEIRKELASQYKEYCSTGTFSKSQYFEHFSFESDGSKKGVWLRCSGSGNDLEAWLRTHFESDEFKSKLNEAQKKATQKQAYHAKSSEDLDDDKNMNEDNQPDNDVSMQVSKLK